LNIVGLLANTRWQELAEQCQRFKPAVAIVTDRATYDTLDRSAFPPETQLRHGDEAIHDLVHRPEVDVVVSAVVGAAGITGTWAALAAGKTVALANKESMVVGGPLITELALRNNAKLLPVDSEHSAIFQAMTGHVSGELERVVLTASGGPFRGKKPRDLENVSPEEASKHPTWNMGRKITIDSATLMNKALEVIEARWLFGLPPERIEVIVHPESIIHSFVEFLDGSVLAQMSPPDMKLPIQYALLYPESISGPAKRLKWSELTQFRFEQVDRETFQALDLGYEVARKAGTTGAVLNAANEAAVERFLNSEIGFLDIARCCREVLNGHTYESQPTLEQLMFQDRWARQEVGRWNPKRIPNR
jgi:1-deoxy-D-xylulose-5-phosphate reductoisomerase